MHAGEGRWLTGSEVMMRGSEGKARQLAAEAVDRGVDARACLDARFGWVVRATTPFHEEEVILRGWDDLMAILVEVAGWS